MGWRLVAIVALLLELTPSPSAAQGATPADVRIAAVTALIQSGRFADAETEAAVVVGDSAAWPADARIAARNVQVEALLANGHGTVPATLALAESLVAAPLPGAPAILSGTRVRNLGRVLLESCGFRAAAGRFQEAIRAHQLAVGPRHIEVAEDLDGLAVAWYWLGRYDAAMGAADRALGIRESIPADQAAVDRTLAIRARIWQQKGQHEKALTDLQRALASAKARAPDHPETAVILALYGDELAQGDRLEEARQALDRARRLMDATLRPDHPELTSVLRPLAIVVNGQGHPEQARELREQSLAIAEQAYGKDHPHVALQLNDLVASMVHDGDYVEARRAMGRALSIYERCLGPRHTQVITAVYNLGVLTARIGDFGEAAELHRRAVLTWEQTAGASHPYLAWALAGLAGALAGEGRHAEAVRYYERALAIRERTLSPTHTLVVHTLTSLASSLVQLGRLGPADAVSARALRICESAATPDSLAECLLVRAHVKSATRDYAGALTLFERFLALRLPQVGPRHPSIADAEAGLAASLAALGKGPDALAAALRAEAIGRDHLRLTIGALSERQALAYAASRPRGLNLALSLVADTASAADVYDALIRSRAVVLDEMATRQRLRASASATPSLGTLWNELASARQKLANLAVRGPADENGQRYAAELDEARRGKERIEAALAESSAAVRQELARKEVGLPEVLASVPARSAVVSFVRYDRAAKSTPAYMAFVLRAGEAGPTPVLLGSAAAIEQAVALWRKDLPRGLRDDGTMIATAEAPLRVLGESLRRKVWAPLAPFLTDVDHVFVVPEADLNLVPFAALPVGRTGYLIDAPYAIHYLSAERDLVAFTTKARAVGRGLLALGGPAYGATRQEAPIRLTVRGVSVTPTGPALPQCLTLQSIAFGELPAAAREAQEVAGLWRQLRQDAASGDARVDTLIGAAATEAAFKRTGAGRRILHLATHGFFLDPQCAPSTAAQGAPGAGRGRSQVSSSLARSPLVFSGLALAGANRRHRPGGGVDDGILTAEEVASLDLDGVQWAVLSACDTGLGSIKTGEGVFGLRRAFEIAGARTVIMSLWSVEDRASRAWMRALYDGRLRAGLSTADALRQASRTILRERRAKGLGTHPFFWAGFVAAGDWR